MSRNIQRIVFVLFFDRVILFQIDFRGEFIEEIFQIASTMKIKRFEQLDEFGKIHVGLVDDPRRRVLNLSVGIGRRHSISRSFGVDQIVQGARRRRRASMSAGAGRRTIFRRRLMLR